MIMYHQTKFSCKKTSSSDNNKKSYIDYIILNCDLDLEDSKPIFLKDNLAHNDASSYQVWKQKGSAVQKISFGQTFTDILRFCPDLDLEHNNPISP